MENQYLKEIKIDLIQNASSFLEVFFYYENLN